MPGALTPWSRGQEDEEFQHSLGYIMKACLKTKKNLETLGSLFISQRGHLDDVRLFHEK